MTQTSNGIYQLQGMSCGNCARHAEKVAKHIDGVSSATVDLDHQTISLSFDHPIDESQLLEAFDTIGYSAVTSLTELAISGMKCNGCASKVQGALKATPGVLHSSLELADGKATVKYWKGRTDPKQLAAVVNELGFPATVAAQESDAA
ncbi:cation transporter [uncultured Cohaesibacter sp.]|uniref:heavy-metal-associated domain-containing protein n=1 Tax=uncultured Cohaesibacter sp. TaxID=1002546 RepID=UPI0029C94F3D|nr:cation transporter [uncultured Cohaesibacter sp.]